MSNADILDLMNFMAVVKIKQLFSKFVNCIRSKQLDIYVDDLDHFVQKICSVTVEKISICYDLTKNKLKRLGRESTTWLDQFKRKSISILLDAEESLMDLLINDVKFSEESDTELIMYEVFVIKASKDKQNEIMSPSFQNNFWNAHLQDLSTKLSSNSKQCIPILLLPIVICFFDKKEMNIKIGILRKEGRCPKIIWLKNDFSTEDKHFQQDVHLLKYHRIEKFLLFNFVFENILVG